MTVINLDFRFLSSEGITGTFTAVLEKPLVLATIIYPESEPYKVAVTNGEGTISLPASQAYGVYYRVTLSTPALGVVWSDRVLVPDSNTPVELSELSGLTPVVGESGGFGGEAGGITPAEVDAAISSAISTHTASSNPHSQYATDADLAGHIAASDPHSQYVLDSDLTAATNSLQTQINAKQSNNTRLTTISGQSNPATVKNLQLNPDGTIGFADPATDGGSLTWGGITGTLSDQTDLQSALNSKAAASHTQDISTINGLQTALDGKQSINSRLSTISSQANPASAKLFQLNTDGTIAFIDPALGGSPTWGTIAGTLSSQTDLQSALSGKADVSHTQNISSINGLQTALDGKAAASHTQDISTINGLQTALDGKAAASHTQDISTINGLQSALDGKQSSNARLTSISGQSNPASAKLFQLNTDGTVTFVDPASSGSSSWGSISGTLSNQTDLQNALNAKQASSTRLTTISGQANPATVKLIQLNTDGTLTFVDPPSGTGTAEISPGDDLVLIAGQSNAVGYGITGGINTVLDFTPTNVWQYSQFSTSTYYNQIIQASEPLEHVDKQTNRVGFGLTFGKLFANAVAQGRRVVLVPCAKGATALNNSGEWRPGTPTGAPLYEGAIAACNALLAANPSNRLVAILWLQGERDSNNNVAGTTYKPLLIDLINGFRSRITGATNVPFVLGRMVPEWVASEGTTSTADEIDEVHRLISLEMPYTWAVDPVFGVQNSTTDSAQTVHYNPIGQRRIGELLYYGYFKALKNSPGSTAGTPTSLATTNITNNSVRITWAAPATGVAYAYRVEYKPTASGNWTTANPSVTNAFQYDLSGLTVGTAYDIRLTGLSYGTPSATVTTSFTTTGSTAPNPVTGLSVTGTTTTTATLSWTAPASGVTPTDYQIEYKTTASPTWIVFSDGTSTSTGATVTGLTSNTAYDFRVAAVASATLSTYVSTSGTTAAITPTAPTGLTVTGTASTTASLSWTAPVGFTPIDYVIQYSLAGANSWSTFSDGTYTTTSTTVTGLTSSTAYDFRVAAVVDLQGPYSGTATGTTSASTITPNPPTGLAVGTVTTSSVQLSWTAPASGAAPTDYRIEYKTSASGTWLTFADGTSTATSTTVTGLTSNTAYDFRVSSVVDNPSSPTSAVSATTSAVVPNAPTGLTTGTVTSTSVPLSWTAPASGAAPTDYQVEFSLAGANSWSIFADGVSTTTSATVTGLTSSTAYDFRVAGKVDAVGAYSSTVSATTSAGVTIPTPFWRVTAATTKTLDGSNLISQWNDDSGNARHLTQGNSARRMSVGTTGGGVSFAQGVVGSTVSSHLIATFPATGSYTKMILVNFDDVTNGTGNLISTNAAGNGSHIIFRQSASTLKSGHNGTFTTLNASSLTLVPGTWYLIWLTWDSTTTGMTLYNGSTSVATATVGAPTGGSFVTTVFLNNYGTGNTAGGNIKVIEAGIWNVALTQPQIESERARMATLYGLTL